MDALVLAISVLLPWAAGTAWLRLPPKGAPMPWTTALGYGHFLGILALTLLMRAASLAGLEWNFRVIALLIAALGAVPFVLARRRLREGLSPPSWRREWADVERWKRVVGALLLAAIAVRFAGLLLEIVWRPLYPWDAWMQWATKARVWFEFGRMVPFVPFGEWAAGDPAKVFTDPTPSYPATIPLL